MAEFLKSIFGEPKKSCASSIDRMWFLLFFFYMPQYLSIFFTVTIKFFKKLAETNLKLKICKRCAAERDETTHTDSKEHR